MKKIYITLKMLFVVSMAFAQNWSYVGGSHFHITGGYIYFPDMEIAANGDILVGYQANDLQFAKYSGGTWTSLPVQSKGSVNLVDIEIFGSTYYMAHIKPISNNFYAYVTKYNGSAWEKVGDSLLLGNVGSVGSFVDLLIDNNGVPTLLANMTAGKKILQFTAGTWNIIYTVPNAKTTSFAENSALFDSQNKLIFVSNDFFVNGSSVVYYCLVNKLDGTTRTTIGDTLFAQTSAIHLKLDVSENPHLIYNHPIKSRAIALKLSGNTWNFIGDTLGAVTEAMRLADLSGDGKIVYSTAATLGRKSAFMYNGGVRTMMDSINGEDFAPVVSNINIPKGSSDVYFLVSGNIGINQSMSVMKHSLTGGTSGVEKITSANKIEIYPNPSNGNFTIKIEKIVNNTSVNIYSISGQLIHSQQYENTNEMNLNTTLQKGMYMVEILNENGLVERNKIIVE